MLSTVKPTLEKQLQKVVTRLPAINPNLLTLTGSIAPLVFFLGVIFGVYWLALFMVLASTFDMLDGMMARRLNRVTAFGGFLDSTVDRIADFFFITAFGFAGLVSWWIVAPLLLVSYLTSYIRSRGELAAGTRHISFAVGVIERPERLIGIFIALLLFMIFPRFQLLSLNIAEWVLMILVVLSAVTCIQRLWHAKKTL